MGARIPIEQADELAWRAIKQLTPVVDRIAVAGSVRRRKAYVGDIELLCKPMVQVGLFGGSEPVTDAIKNELWKMGRWVRGAKRYMKISDLYGQKGFSLDVYLVHPPSEWGTQMLIRTGPREFSTRIATRLKEFDTPFRDGRILNLQTGRTISTPEESDVFRAAKIEFIEPQARR